MASASPFSLQTWFPAVEGGGGSGKENREKCSEGNGKNSGGGSAEKIKTIISGGGARVRVRYDAHLPALYFWGGENSRTILVGTVFPTLNVHVLCKHSHICGVFWEDCEHKHLHIPTPPPQ